MDDASTHALVEIMLDYGLSWLLQNDAENFGVRSYQLDPPIHSVGCFELSANTEPQIKIPDSKKQSIAHEVEMQRVRRFSSNQADSSPNQEPAPTALPATLPQLQRTMTQLAGRLNEDPGQAPVSIMGFVKRSSNGSKVATSTRDSNPVKYKFKEGFSAAVRRTVSFKDFL